MHPSRHRLTKIRKKKGFDPAKLEIWDRDLFDLLNIIAGDDIDIWFYLNAISLIDRDKDKIYMYRLGKLGDLERLFKVFPGTSMMMRRIEGGKPPLPLPSDYPYQTVRDEFMKHPDDRTLKVLDLNNAEDITFFNNLLIEHKRMIEATREKLGSFIKDHFDIADVL